MLRFIQNWWYSFYRCVPCTYLSEETESMHETTRHGTTRKWNTTVKWVQNEWVWQQTLQKFRASAMKKNRSQKVSTEKALAVLKNDKLRATIFTLSLVLFPSIQSVVHVLSAPLGMYRQYHIARRDVFADSHVIPIKHENFDVTHNTSSTLLGRQASKQL